MLLNCYKTATKLFRNDSEFLLERHTDLDLPFGMILDQRDEIFSINGCTLHTE